jgi:hypothetical protein
MDACDFSSLSAILPGLSKIVLVILEVLSGLCNGRESGESSGKEGATQSL